MLISADLRATLPTSPELATGDGTSGRNAFESFYVAQTLTVGISGVRRNAAAALCAEGELRACCEHERVTRVRGVRLQPGLLPAEALAAVLSAAGGRQPSDIALYAVAEDGAELPEGLPVARVEHHRAHAASAFYTSRFDRAAVLVCDRHGTPSTSVWIAEGNRLAPRTWPDIVVGFASLYSTCSEVFGFGSGQEHRLEALARLDPGHESERLERIIRYKEGALDASPGWRGFIAAWLSDHNGHDPVRHRAGVASAFQRHLGRLLLQVVTDVRAETGLPHLCLAGGLFYNTYFNTLIQRSGIFDDVFVAPNPGNAGLAPGAALAASQQDGSHRRRTVSPFLGPQYDLQQIKNTLDNCKLSYACVSEREVIDATVNALRRGQMVGWFQGRMEWAHRALGNRSILASPLSPYVLDNLNLFLKQRERHTTYGLSVPESDVSKLFSGPPVSTFMEYDFDVIDRERLRHVLPGSVSTLRVQTVAPTDEASRRYLHLHEAFGEATGLPVLVNTSFNGFSEPIVCSPRDAIRVFFGTGLDMLALDRFLVFK